MERIQKALEKAHQQRQYILTQRPVELQKGEKSQPLSVDEISYKTTPTINISHEVLMKNRIVAALKNDPRSDLFKILRTKVLQKMRSENMNVLAMTSPTVGVGKSLMAINLAVSIAMDVNYSALLVDLDLRNPSVHKYFGLSPKLGMSNYFTEDRAVSDLLIHPNLDSLVILPAGQPMKDSSELLSTPKMLNLSLELKNRYPDRIVVVNLPPLLNTDDAMAFIPNVDTCILVVSEGQTTKDEIEHSLQLIGEKKYLGTILNKSAQAL